MAINTAEIKQRVTEWLFGGLFTYQSHRETVFTYRSQKYSFK